MEADSPFRTVRSLVSFFTSFAFSFQSIHSDSRVRVFVNNVTGNRTRNKIETFNISPFIFILIPSLFIIPSLQLSHLIRNRNIRVSLTVFEIPPLPMCTYREDIAQRRLINTLSRYQKSPSGPEWSRVIHWPFAKRWWTIYVYKRCHRSLLGRIVHRCD